VAADGHDVVAVFEVGSAGTVKRRSGADATSKARDEVVVELLLS
jgi:hypothetical protein